MRHAETAAADGRLRVAAYCRVSTDKEDQLNSLTAQRRFFEEYIREHREWVSMGVFADEGLSGTSVRRRPQLTELLRRAFGGEIDLILTKEVSRFARNTVDTLQVTRQLKESGVGVCFLNDGIDTRDNDGEFRLTIMASVAQEESRKISERTRWGQLQAMKRGVVFGNDTLYGFTLRRGRLLVQPEEAEVVRTVYRRFLVEEMGAHAIARTLTEEGIRPPLRSAGAWSPAMVLRILRNEKYCGDLMQKKYRTTDYLSHRKVLNTGAEERFCLRDHHEAIVSREQFEAAQTELLRRGRLAADKRRFSARYWYSGKVRCGACGRSFALKRTRRADGTEYRRFVCRGHWDEGCGMRPVRAEAVLAAARAVLDQLPLNREAIVEEVLAQLPGPGNSPPKEAEEAEKLRQAIRRQSSRRDRALEAFLDGDLTREELRRMTARCEEELARLERRMQLLLTAGEAAEERGGVQAGYRERLERELAGGDALLDAAIQEITVCPDCLLVKAAELPVRFRVDIMERGRGRKYTAEAERCTPVPAEDTGPSGCAKLRRR